MYRLESRLASTSLICKVPSPFGYFLKVGVSGRESTSHCISIRGNPATGHGSTASLLLIVVKLAGDRAEGDPIEDDTTENDNKNHV